MVERLRQPPGGRKAEILPQADCALVGGDDEIELDGAKAARFGTRQQWVAMARPTPRPAAAGAVI